MTFTTDTAFNYLRENSHVYTFRASLRAEPNEEVWISRGRGEPKKFDGVCEEVESCVPPTTDILDEYSADSRFKTGDNRKEAIHEVNNGFPAGGFIYRVERDV